MTTGMSSQGPAMQPTGTPTSPVAYDLTDRLEPLGKVHELLTESVSQARETTPDAHDHAYLDSVLEEINVRDGEFRRILEEGGTAKPSRADIHYLSGLGTEVFALDPESELEVQVYGHEMSEDSSNTPMYFLLNTAGSERRVRHALSQIYAQMALVPDDYDPRLLVAVNNSGDRTADEVRDYLDSRDEVQATVYNITTPLHGFGKLQATNFLIDRVREQVEGVESPIYITIVDDDIAFAPEATVMSNVEELEANEQLRFVSANPVTYQDYSGFELAIAARKFSEVQEEAAYPRVYGTCLTFALSDFPEAGLPLNGGDSDVYFSYKALQDYLENFDGPIEDIDVLDLPARTNPRLQVVHYENFELLHYVRRTLRDFELAESLIGEMGTQLMFQYQTLQNTHFGRVADQIPAVVDGQQRNIAHTLYREFRKQLQDAYRDGYLRSSDFNELVRINPMPGSAYDFVRGLYTDPTRLERIEQVVQKHDLFTQQEQQVLDDPEAIGKAHIKQIENALRRNIEGPRKILIGNNATRDIQTLEGIIQLNDDLRTAMSDPAQIAGILEAAGIPIEEGVELRDSHAQGHANFYAFPSVGDRRFFIRYHDLLGNDYIPKQSPENLSFTYRLAEEIYALTMGGRATVRTVYPSLDQARANRAYGEEKTRKQILLQRVIVQEDLSDDFVVMADYDAHGVSQADMVRSYARLLAQLHAGTMLIDNPDAPKQAGQRRAARLFEEGRNYMRVNDSSSFEQWLTRFSGVHRHVAKSVQDIRADVHPTWSGFGAALDLEDLWDDTQTTSMRLFRHLRSMGHFDFSPTNSFISPTTLDGVLYDYDYIGLHDPFHEAAQALFALNSRINLLDKSTLDVDAAMDPLKLFIDTYQDELSVRASDQLEFASQTSGLTVQELLSRGIANTGRISGLMMLGNLNPNKYVAGKDQLEFVNPLNELARQMITGQLTH